MTSSRWKVGPFGGTGGNHEFDWHLPEGGRIMEIELLQSGDHLGGIWIKFFDPDPKGPRERDVLLGEGGDRFKDHMELEEDEYLAAAWGWYGWYVNEFSIATNTGKHVDTGVPSDIRFYLEPADEVLQGMDPPTKIVGFFGKYGSVIDRLGLYLEKA